MFFSHLARIIAWLAFLFGLANLAIGIAIATGYIGPYEAAVARYTGAETSGDAIDRSLYVLLFAIALGAIAEMSFNLRKSANAQR